MNRDYVQADHANNPKQESFYNEVFNADNYRFIQIEVRDRLRELFPGKPDYIPTSKQIQDSLWEYFQFDPAHPQVMIQKVINFYVGSIKSDRDHAQDVEERDPWIQAHPETYGITQYQNRNIKLNDRRADTLSFQLRQ